LDLKAAAEKKPVVENLEVAPEVVVTAAVPVTVSEEEDSYEFEPVCFNCSG